ncbi:MAG: alpha-ketoacid dehydrogenase subunit beta [Chloroflexota bacterium]|jgi:pyruvate dehydrogenase E1 component beta subunit|nr:alpha-ketoacid dehydrogenase subunit beta [Chloroflexota bacterium]
MRELTYSQALREALYEEMARDANIILLGEDIGVYGGLFKVTDGLLAKYGPNRVLETPISESGFIGAAVGLAMCGKHPMAELMFMDFAWVAADQIFNQACKMRQMSGGQVSVPLVIRTQQGGGRGNAAQHSQSLEAHFAHIPGIKIALPSTPYDAKGLLKQAFRENDPVIVIEHKLLYNTKGNVPEQLAPIPFGVADVKRTGKDVTLISYSRTVLHALEAAETLAQAGIDVEVIDLRTIHPLDMDTIAKSVRKTTRVVIAHESHRNAGFGAELSARISETCFGWLDAPIERVGALDVPIAYSQPLEAHTLPSPDKIVQAVKRVKL